MHSQSYPKADQSSMAIQSMPAAALMATHPTKVPAWGVDMQKQRQAPLLPDAVQPHLPAWRRRVSWLSSSTSARSFFPFTSVAQQPWGSDG